HRRSPRTQWPPSIFNGINNDPKHTAKTTQEWLWDKSLNFLEWPGQTMLPSNLTELERICREEWEKLPKYWYAKLVASYRRRLKAVIAAKGASTKY
uniref:HMG box domain-containing protein n=1 Tax=Oncorhynchus kisutch TaxID=8019 RepID=A0A8C7GE80_ONCKI